MAAGGGTRGRVYRQGLGIAGVDGVSAWCVSGLVSAGGARGMLWGQHCWLLGGGAGGGAVLDGSLGSLQGRVGAVCACRAVVKVPGWLRCRGTGRELLPGHPDGAVVRKQLVAAGGWCLSPWCAGGGAAVDGGVLFVGHGGVGALCVAPSGSMGAYSGPNVVSPCSGGGRWWWW